jgi:hypothetical protein
MGIRVLFRIDILKSLNLMCVCNGLIKFIEKRVLTPIFISH